MANSDSCLWIEPYCTEKVISNNPLFDPIDTKTNKQIVELSNEVVNNENWTPSILQTYGTRYLIRAKEALTWTLNIKDSGFHNDAIQASYNKVLTIVNSLFILGLLAIATMWMLSIIISRKYLKKVIIVYAGAVIFVNFALPINRLLIDGTNLLQTTLLTQDGKAIGITEIIQTPKYEDVIGYRNNSQNVTSKSELQIKPGNGNTESGDINIAKVDTGSVPATGLITGGLNNESIELNMPEQSIILNANQTISITQESKFNQYNEHAIFSFLLITATGTAYLLLALIFIVRIVILWALLILSPILLLLSIFKVTRGWFINWLSIYGKWLLIGPLTALGIAVIVNIWQKVGLPIENTYVGDTFANNMTNIAFYLPGKNTPNTLSNTGEMMEYIVFLLMLYIPIFFAFALTRQKCITGIVTGIAERISRKTSKKVNTELQEITTNEIHTKNEKDEISTEREGFIDGLKNVINTNIAKITETAMPLSITDTKHRNAHTIQTASNFIPEKLSVTSIHKMMELIGVDKKSRHSREIVIEKLASPKYIEDTKERERVSTIRNEIEKRSFNGNPEAMILMGEMESKLVETSAPFKSTAKTHETNEHTTIEILKNKEINQSNSESNHSVSNEKKVKPEQIKQSSHKVDKEKEEEKENQSTESDDDNRHQNKPKKTKDKKEKDKPNNEQQTTNNKQQTTNNKQRTTNMKKAITTIGTLTIGLLSPSTTYAQNSVSTELGEVSNFGELISLIWAYSSNIIIALAVFFIVLGALFYITSAGNEEKIAQGKEMIFGALIAIVIVLTSGILIRLLHKPASGTRGALAEIPSVIGNATNILIGIIGAFTVLMLVYTAIMYITAHGNISNIKKAHNAFRYAIYGLIIGVLAFTIANTVIKLLI